MQGVIVFFLFLVYNYVSVKTRKADIMRYIEDIRDGDAIVGHYFCKDKQTLKSRAGKTYLSITLTDRTGALNGKVWELGNNIQSFEAGDYIKVDGSVSTFNDELQLKINKIRKSMPGEYQMYDYIPSTRMDVDEMYDELAGYMRGIQNPFIKALIGNIFGDEDTAQKFKLSTAAKTLHHNYAGGLLEHTLSVVQLCDFMSGRYKSVNRDILIAAAMLHDIGKIWELTGFPENGYTDAGQLLGHIYMGAELITREAGKIPDFPAQLAMILKHCILAHHGDYEFGSPKLPSVIEAFILFNCDNLDAKVFAFIDIIDKDKTPGKWTGYNKMFQRSIRKTE